MFTVANTFNTNDYYTDNNSVICTIAYNDYGTTGYDAWAEYNRRTQEVKILTFSQVQDFFLNLFYFMNVDYACVVQVAERWPSKSEVFEVSITSTRSIIGVCQSG